MLHSLNDLRNALLKLPATGADGFEGLLAVVLEEISGVPFRLAGSGSQFGLDGKAAYQSDGVCFEGKRYDGDIPRTEVLSKIAELTIGDRGDVDLWVLGATKGVRSQLVDDVRELAQKSGIATLILDWSSTGLPPLAVALTMASAATENFFGQYVNEGDHVARATAALKAIREDNGYTAHATRVRTQLEESTTGAGLAKRANIRWLTDVFCSRQRARHFLRQPLSPGDKGAGQPVPRDALVKQIVPLLTGKPNGKIAAVLGDEGNGKSWVVAQSWLSIADKPITVVFTADDFNESLVPADLTGPLIDKIIAQTDGPVSEAARNRWRRRIEQWSKAGTPDSPRLVVIIDGLNQRPRVDWARLIEAMASELDRIGGRLIVTARTAFYASQVRGRLYSSTVQVNVPEWTDAERDAILAAHDIHVAGLHPAVAISLRNPRLLAIALELLQKAQIGEMEELSVSRLLFEHMRAHERDAPSPRPANEFARKLQDHAREVLSRAATQKRDDLEVFDGGLEAVSDGRFFVALEGDPTRYRLDENGLTLALGFAVLDELRAALRNNRDLADALGIMLEPVSALDRTADVVLAALTVACLDENCPTEIGAAIVGAFAELQNPNTDHFPAFAALAGKRPEAFMQAAQRLCLAAEHQSNFDWVRVALHNAKENDGAWAVMIPWLQSWLGLYSLSPAVRMLSHPGHDPAEKVQEERTKIQDKIDAAMGTLSGTERQLLDRLVRKDDGDLNALSRFAFTLMAGKPLAQLTASLMHWSFTNALNTSPWAPYKEFTDLVRLNGADWQQARESMLDASKVLEAVDVSRTGKWALVNILSATGDPADAARVDALIGELTADRPRFQGWRRVEHYCATDPCNPGSAKPENIAATAANYAAIDEKAVRLYIGNTDVDHFFEMARAGMARFEAQIAIDKHRAFIADVLERNGLPLRQGILEMHRHNALVTSGHAERLVERVREGTAGGGLGENDAWFISQYHLLVSFPLLSANQQIDALLYGDVSDNILLDLMEIAKPLEEAAFEARLDRAVRDNDERAQFVTLAFARSTGTPLSSNARAHLARLTQSPVERVRAQALGLIVAVSDEQSIDAVLKSGWTVTQTSQDDGYEAWYGSLLVIEAAKRKMISFDEALNRMTPALYGAAAKRLDNEALRGIAQRIDASIKAAAGLSLDIAVPDIELRHRDGDGIEPARYLASEKCSPSHDPVEALRLMSETNEAFEERQKRLSEAFEAFKAELTRTKAQIILDGLRMKEFDAIAESDREFAESWFDFLAGLPKARRRAVHNIGLLLAHALANWNPEKAACLFSTLRDGESLVRITFGRASLPLDAISLWSAKDHIAIEALRFDRLDKAGNDDDLATEVLAALWNGKQRSLQGYIEARLQTGRPADIARALMVAGFCERSDFNEGVLKRFKGTPGFIGKAAAAAEYAYERNTWSHHWFESMREAQRPEDFWSSAVLLAKVADGRIDLWRKDNPAPGSPHSLFWPSVEKGVEQRIKKWREQRKKKLFGDDAPAKVFLS
ncbi:hypothetical protein [Bradyrhizobium stylosanthis]|uniref:hypothetical protein n=1 Tax=Bradyrhizobium stylosanthis TaxID=1803665 RepID=UPI0012E78EE1|nr:hypothetical protein [Bradyrhizobium stylosanthis]